MAFSAIPAILQHVIVMMAFTRLKSLLAEAISLVTDHIVFSAAEGEFAVFILIAVV